MQHDEGLLFVEGGLLYNVGEALRARRPAARRLAIAGEGLFSRKTSPATLLRSLVVLEISVRRVRESLNRTILYSQRA